MKKNKKPESGVPMPQTRKISKNNTTVLCNKGSILVTLHQTPVVDVRGDIVTLDNGGWVTATTQTRMNQAANEFGLGYHVQREDGEMYVHVQTEFALGKPCLKVALPFANGRVSFSRKTGKRVDL